ncbi:MAG: tripartite tricarboxylate transporter substrate binding protein [Pigmentiphaga sp.]|uniref:Bug family tripartite tricarboxylate transporter substrate binding protein n=1 Tax=Pigmentiphaga sp. TaxID=1977564 RepID=UPI0029AF7CBD|nr:tripartite tricarboxylate transporter substrate binding protein [Pigmentiphaga sp.]MDX3906069.1 tripartite tricarboxylate transporter substrate binding protein [Pigmentiphaga sp.]
MKHPYRAARGPMPRLLAAAIAAVAVQAGHAGEPAYPARPVRLIVPYAPGGVTDVSARLVAQHLSTLLGRSVYVENKGGGGTRIGAAEAAKAAPDGYTLLYANSITHGTLPATAASLPFDPVKDFAPVAKLFWYASTIVCHPSVPADTVAELADYAKAHPGKLSYASAGPGTGNHFSSELFNAMAGVKIVHVPYRGSGPALQDVVAGQVSCTHDGAAKPQVDAGKVKAIATTGIARDPRFPDLPTVDEAGLKGYDMTWWQGLMAPAGTPPEVVARLTEAVRTLAGDEAFRAKAYDIGLNVQYAPPDALAEQVRRDIAKFRKIAADANIVLD